MKKQIHKFYKRHIRKHISDELTKQRLKLLLWDIFGYTGVFTFKNISFIQKLQLLRKFLKLDWNVIHAHKPAELVPIFKDILDRKGDGTSVVVEAGCWNGGSTAKYSLVCRLANYPLHVYDSFEGVEPGDEAHEEAFFYGTYAGPLELVKANVEKYGSIEVCTFHKGFFIDSMKDFNYKTYVVYIDCDLSKGTLEVLQATYPHLISGAKVYSQDYHIPSIKEMLHQDATWASMQMPKPNITHIVRNVALLDFFRAS